VGTILAAREVGEDRFADMLARFGLGKRTGVGLPGESPGRVPSRETWSGSTFGNLPIGQGLSVTALQMAGMYQAVANDGLRIPPRIVEATVGPDGVRTPTPAPEPVRVVSPETARAVRTMLSAVTQGGGGHAEQRGTGFTAAIPGYQVAGKTGTAQQVDPKCGCYASSTYWITFAGMLPAQDPRYVVAIMLDAPQGGTSAAPLMHDIGSYLAQREKLPVSTEPNPEQTLVVHPAATAPVPAAAATGAAPAGAVPAGAAPAGAAPAPDVPAPDGAAPAAGAAPPR
jgi:cell division protein FtsI (penicillin-binding protein 3)